MPKHIRKTQKNNKKLHFFAVFYLLIYNKLEFSQFSVGRQWR